MQVNLFDLNLLRALDALLAERNVTRAAERLFVTQQAMSGALRRLRGHFEDELLVRVGRHLELTPLAQSLVGPVREALLQVYGALETRPTFEPARAERRFRIAMSDYASLTLLPRLLRRLAVESPGIRCHVEGLSDASFPRIESGDLEFCISASDGRLYETYRRGPDIRSDPLFHDDFVCVVDRGHPDVGAEMSLELYRRLPHNVVRFGRGVTTIVELGWSDARLEMNVAATAPSFSILLFMLPGTRLVATAQRRLARVLAASLPLRLLECPVPLAPLKEDLLWHARNEFDPAHQYMRGALRAAAEELDRLEP